MDEETKKYLTSMLPKELRSPLLTDEDEGMEIKIRATAQHGTRVIYFEVPPARLAHTNCPLLGARSYPVVHGPSGAEVIGLVSHMRLAPDGGFEIYVAVATDMIDVLFPVLFPEEEPDESQSS